MISVLLSHLTCKFEFKVPQVSSVLRYSQISEIGDFQRFLGHRYQILALRGILWSLITLVVLDNTDANNFINESEVLKLVGELIQHCNFFLSKP